MLIERILSEPQGTVVTFPPDVSYHFKPQVEGGPHVAEVEDSAHIERLLSIRDGYRAAEEIPAVLEPVLDAAAEANVALMAAAKQAAQEAEAQADDATALRVAEHALGAQTDDELRAIYEAEIGKKPHPQTKRETLIEKIEAARKAQ